MPNTEKHNAKPPKHSKPQSRAGVPNTPKTFSISQRERDALYGFLLHYFHFHARLIGTGIQVDVPSGLCTRMKYDLIKTGMPNYAPAERVEAIQLLEGVQRHYWDVYSYVDRLQKLIAKLK